MSGKKASVIIPTYKNFEYIYSALDSVFNQTYDEIEIIICDDSSPNFPYKQISSYINNRKGRNIISVDLYSNHKNLGTVKNLNKAIKRSNGNYIVILSNDDCFYNKYTVSKIVDRLDKSKDGIITCRRLLCNESLKGIKLVPTSRQISKIEKLNTSQKQHRAFIRGEFYDLASGSCTYFTKKRIMEDGLYNEKYYLLEDWTYYVDLTRHIKIETAYDIISVKYRKGGVSSSLPQSLLNDYLRMINTELKYYKSEYSLADKRYLRFNLQRFSGKKYCAYILYPDILVKRFLYKIQNGL